jgi:hypothetical protein
MVLMVEPTIFLKQNFKNATDLPVERQHCRFLLGVGRIFITQLDILPSKQAS